MKTMAEGPLPSGQESLEAYFAAYVQGQVAALRALDARQAKLDQDFVHDSRVALRHLSAVFRALMPWLRAKTYRKLSAELKHARTRLGGVRDADVVLALYDEFMHSGPAVPAVQDAPFRAHLEGWREAERLHAGAFLASARYEALLQTLARPAGKLAREKARPKGLPTRPREVATLTVQTAVARLFACDAWLQKGTPTEKKLHRMRIRFKRLRYLLDFFAPLFGETAARGIEICKRAQDILGDMHDRAAAETVALAYWKRLPGEAQCDPKADLVAAFAADCRKGAEEKAAAFLTFWQEEGRNVLRGVPLGIP